MSLICHLLHAEAWERALDRRTYKPASLNTEGFIHFSTPEQLLATAERHFPLDQDLVVLYISPRKVAHKLKWEAGSNGEMFPHIYGPVFPEEVEFTRYLIRNPEGNWDLVY